MKSVPDLRRLALIGDSVFAVSIPLNARALTIPRLGASGFDSAVRTVLDGVVAVLLSVIVACAFWLGHWRYFRNVRSASVALIAAHCTFLLALILLPISTDLYATNRLNPVATLVYGLNLLLLSVVALIFRVVAVRHSPNRTLLTYDWLGLAGVIGMSDSQRRSSRLGCRGASRASNQSRRRDAPGATVDLVDIHAAAESHVSLLRRLAPIGPLIAASLLSSCATRAIGIDERGTIDRQVEAIARSHAVDGIGVAIIRRGEVVYLHTVGARDAAHSLPLTRDTVMYGASWTKAAFAVYVMQRVDDGTIELDRPIADYLPRPLPDYPRYADLAGDPRWRRLTFRMLLTHTTGFANFRWLEPDRTLRFHRDPGGRYGYSGEGMQLAQFVLSVGFGIDLGREMQRRIFDPFAMTRTSMTWREDFAENVADVALADNAGRPHRRRVVADAAGSMDTTLSDMAAFAAAIVRGDGLSPRARQEMTGRQIAIDSVSQFPTLDDERTDAYRAIGLGYGLGWGVFETPRGHAFFKEGHDDGTGNYLMCIDRERSCIVLMSNSDRGEQAFATLVRMLMRVDIPWRWEGYAPAMPVDGDAG